MANKIIKEMRVREDDGTLSEIYDIGCKAENVQTIDGQNLENTSKQVQKNTSDIVNLDNKINSTTSGSPAGVYDTLEALQQANPDHSKIYLVLADGNWYYYKNETQAWATGGIYHDNEAIDIAVKELQEQITANKNNVDQLAETETSQNKQIYNLAKKLDIKNNYYSSSTGNLSGSGNHDCSNFIKVYKDEIIDYCLRGSNPMAGLINFYDNDKIFVKNIAKGDSNLTNIEGSYAFTENGYITITNRKDYDGYAFIRNSLSQEVYNARTSKDNIQYSSLKENIDNQFEKIENGLNSKIIQNFKNVRFELGSIDGITGKPITDSRIMHCLYYFKLISGTHIKIKPGYKVSLAYYKKDKTFQYNHQWITEENTYQVPNEAMYYRVIIARVDKADITLEDIKQANLIIEQELPIISYENLNKRNIKLNDILVLKNEYFNKNDKNYAGTITHNASTYMPVKKGDVISYSLRGSDDRAGLLNYFDIDKNYIETPAVAVSPSTSIDGSYTIPNDGYIVVCNRKDYDGYLYFENNIPDKVRVLEKELINYKIPHYWKDYLKDKINSIRQINNTIGSNGITFAFITDMHWQDNAKHSPALLKEITKKTETDTIIFGGDLLNLDSTKEEAIENTHNCLDSFSGTNLICTPGNHDWNDNQADKYPNAHLNNNAVYNTHIRRSEKLTNTKQKLYFYIDNPSQKIRILFVNSGKAIEKDQQDWIINSIKELDKTWKCMIITHMYFNPTLPNQEIKPSPNGTLLKNLIDAHYNEFKCEFIGFLVGHIHRDLNIATEKGYVIISTKCDAYTKGQNENWGGIHMELGTTTEQAFDIVSIDFTNKKIYMTRIGAGEDRIINY